MGLLQNKVKDIVKTRQKRKWEILKEKCGDDIAEMIKNNIPIRTQVELILQAGIVEKLTLSEYYNMLKKHFGYEGGKKEKIRVFEVSEKDNNIQEKKAHVDAKTNGANRTSVKSALRQDINILKAAGIDVDEALSGIATD